MKRLATKNLAMAALLLMGLSACSDQTSSASLSSNITQASVQWDEIAAPQSAALVSNSYLIQIR